VRSVRAGKAVQLAAKAEAQVQSAAASALLAGRWRSADGVRAAVDGLSSDQVDAVKSTLRGGLLDVLSDEQLLGLAFDAMTGKSAAVLSKHVASGDVAKSTTAVEAPTDTGYVEGYASTWLDRGGADRQGEVVRPGAFRKSAAAINAGLINVPLTATGGEHEFSDPSVVVGKIVRAVEDKTGLWIRATWNADPVAQRLRVLAKGGGLSFSIGGVIEDSGPIRLPNGRTAKELITVDLLHVQVTSGPANSSARIITAKDESASLVYTDSEWLERERRRRDPDMARRRAEDETILQHGLPAWILADPELRDQAYRGIQVAAVRKSVLERPADPVGAARQRQYEQANRHSWALAEWNRAHAKHRRCGPGGCDE
jgi:HK97 family phage prohead protease